MVMRPEKAWISHVVGYAPELARAFGRFFAFVGLFGLVTMMFIVIRPEAAIAIAAVFAIGVIATLIAALRRPID